MRLDQYLVENNQVRSRSRAKELIQNGKIKVNKKTIKKPSYICEHGVEVEISDKTDLEWVARSGQKLYGALECLNINLEKKLCLDVGQSTGGFTQAMLKKGADQVIGIDVGKGQLDKGLRELSNVHCYESFDARDLVRLKREWRVDFFAVDVSFISILKIFENLRDFVKIKNDQRAVKGLLLIKPQFEVGQKKVKKGGLVDSPLIHLECEKQVLSNLTKMGAVVLDYFPSNIRGRNGNQEFICYISL